MYKFRLLPVRLLTLTCLTASFFSSQLLSAATTPASLTPLPILLPQDFMTAVNDSNTQAQSGLCTTLTQLLKSTSPPPGCSSAANPVPSVENTAASPGTSPQPDVQTEVPVKNPQLDLYSH